MPELALPAGDVRRSADRARTRTDWLDSRHSFSYGPHYDPGNTSYGLLLAHNEDLLRPGGGFDPHRHVDVEVVTWVLRGSLAHQDSTGHRGVVRAGQVQRLSAGSGVVHSEHHVATGPERAGDPRVGPSEPDDACGPSEPDDACGPGSPGDAHYVQVWVASDGASRVPGYELGEVDGLDIGVGLVPVAAGRGHDAAVRIGQRDAVLHVARLAPGGSVNLPDAPFVHLFVALGDVALVGAGTLGPGDAVRLTGAGGPTVTAASAAELLVWEMHAALR